MWVRHARMRHARLVGRALRGLEFLRFHPRLRAAYRGLGAAVSRPPRIVDVGANDGSSVRFFARTFGTISVIAFEPDPDAAARLRRRTRHLDIVVVPIACSDSGGRRVLSRCIFDEVSTLEPIDERSTYLRRKSQLLLTPPDQLYMPLDVEACRLDDYFGVQPERSFDILKIDVEGHELSVLRGAVDLLSQHVFRVIQLEAHEDDQYRVEHGVIDEILTRSGYRLHARIRHSFGNFFEELWVIDEATQVDQSPLPE